MKTYCLQMTIKIGNIVFPYRRLVNGTNLKNEVIKYIKAGYVIESIKEVKENVNV